MKRILSIALALAVTVTMCFGSIGTSAVYATDSDDRIATSVYDGDKLVKEYTLGELKAIAAAEGDIKYKFSGYNRNPSFYIYGDKTETYGPTVAGILADAGVTYEGEQLISFAAPDGVTESFIASDFFKERYYFPNGKIAVPYTGTKPTDENYTDAEPVVPIIDLSESDDWESVLRFGQTAPNEQNNAAFVKYIADGGKIIVGDVQTEAWEPITTANYGSGEILPETEIVFTLPANMIGKKVAAYYTTDGSEPYHGDAIYNYDKYGSVQEIVLPDRECTVTYTFKVVGYGKLDSEVTTFTYEVKDVAGPDAPTGFTVTAPDYQTAALSWTPVDEAAYYEILKYDATTEKHEVYAQTTETSYVDAAVTASQEFSYQVRAVKQLSSGQLVYGSAAAKQSIVIPAEPVVEPETPAAPAKVTLKSAAKTGYGGIQIKWNKVVAADGYEVWRYDAVSKKWAKVKTFANNNTVSWKNTGLKTGRKYTYKVRAYITYEGEKIYGKYSGTRAARPVLNTPAKPKLIAGKKSVTVKWKQVPGANGYKIYRSTTGKAGSFKVVKTIKKGGTVSWKNTKLKKGQRYYYKVKAYRIVDKKYVYSNMSLSNYIKSK